MISAARILLISLGIDRRSAVPRVKRLTKLLAILWLMAALSLVGWLIVNLDTAGWILLVLTIGLMTFELTRRPGRASGWAKSPRQSKKVSAQPRSRD